MTGNRGLCKSDSLSFEPFTANKEFAIIDQIEEVQNEKSPTFFTFPTFDPTLVSVMAVMYKTTTILTALD